MFDIHKVGRQITELRRIQGLSQMQLAEMLDISFQAVSNWERGLSMPDIAKLPELAEILNTSIDGLFGIGQAEPRYERVSSTPSKPDVVETVTTGLPAERLEAYERKVHEIEPYEAGYDRLAHEAEAHEEAYDHMAREAEVGITEALESEDTGTSEVTLSSLCALAPFMSCQSLSDLAETVTEVEPDGLVGLAMSIDESTLYRLALRLLEQDATCAIEHLCRLAPFLSKKSLGDMALRATDVNTAQLAGLAPFLDRDTIDQLAKTCSLK